MDIHYCPWYQRKIQFQTFYYIHIIEIPTNKGVKSCKLKLSQIGNEVYTIGSVLKQKQTIWIRDVEISSGSVLKLIDTQFITRPLWRLHMPIWRYNRHWQIRIRNLRRTYPQPRESTSRTAMDVDIENIYSYSLLLWFLCCCTVICRYSVSCPWRKVVQYTIYQFFCAISFSLVQLVLLVNTRKTVSTCQKRRHTHVLFMEMMRNLRGTYVFPEKLVYHFNIYRRVVFLGLHFTITFLYL